MIPPGLTHLLLASCLMAATLHAQEESLSPASRHIDFRRDIRPILSANCFQCHGPDENTREADLRLDVAEAAYEDRGGYRALVPGDSHRSELLRRVCADDPEELMPPASSGKSLTSSQIELLRRWIKAGAKYQQHWAFVASQRPPLPEVQNFDWPSNEIDYFILDRLERDGLAPSPEADRYQLVRRLYLDLIGFMYQGRSFRLTDVHGNIVEKVLS